MVLVNIEDAPAPILGAAGAIIEELNLWYEALRNPKGSVDSNVMCAGLYITEFLAVAFPLTALVFAADSQVRGASGAKAKAILAEHGETRRFTSEGGRTSRYTIRHAEKVAEIINSAGGVVGVDLLAAADRRILAGVLQHWFVGRIRDDFFGRKRISAEINPDLSVRAIIANVLAAGRERSGTAAGAIAQHLVGAKLQIRFPDEDINVESHTTADKQTGRAGDYQIGDTAIHVTMAPGDKVFGERCKHNIEQGFRPRVLVPEQEIPFAVAYARAAGITGQVAIESIEDFIGTNIEEVAGFRKQAIRVELRRLLELYNTRIEQAEADMSLKIDIPENL